MYCQHLRLDQAHHTIAQNLLAEGSLLHWNQNAGITLSELSLSEIVSSPPMIGHKLGISTASNKGKGSDYATYEPPENLGAQQSIHSCKPCPTSGLNHSLIASNSTPLLLTHVKEYMATIPNESFQESILRNKPNFLCPLDKHTEGQEICFDLVLDSSRNNCLLYHESTLKRYFQVLEAIQAKPWHCVSTLELAHIKNSHF